MNFDCLNCRDTGHVCENHPDRPWAGLVGHVEGACGDGYAGCGGAGTPCPACCSPIPEDGTHRIGEAFTPDRQRRP